MGHGITGLLGEALMLERMVRTNLPVSIERIEAFEKRWESQLTDPYFSFLAAHNGGRPIPAAFPIHGFDSNPFGVVQTFLGLDAAIHSCDIEWHLENLGVPRPSGLVPIASTGGSDLLCLDTVHYGRILYWDRIACWGKESWSPMDFYHVADDFEHLLGSLFPFSLSE